MSRAADMLVFRNDLIERSVARLIAQDSEARRPRLCALVTAAACAAKLSEATQLSIFFGMTYEGASGEQRDNWGKIIGEARNGLNEAEYRLYQDLRIYINTTDATVPKAIVLLQMAFPTRTVTAAINLPNGAGFQVTGGPLASQPIRSHLEQLFRDYQPAGHNWFVAESPSNAIEFGRTFDDNETRTFSELIFPGR